MSSIEVATFPKIEIRTSPDGSEEVTINGTSNPIATSSLVPHDPAMDDGVLRFGSLLPDTQRARLVAGAAVARGL